MNVLEEPESKRQDIEMFSKFNILPNELRCHTLTYSSPQTLFNYSQCSKLCNSVIQQFNTKTPRFLDLIDESDGIFVKFSDYVDNDPNETIGTKSMGEKKFDFSKSENVMNDLVKHLEAFFKYNKNGKTERINIKLRQWPKEILKIEQIKEIKQWRVTMYRSMFDDCLKFAKSDYGKLDSLFLHQGEEVDVIPRDFFKCDAIKKLKYLYTTKCEIDDDDFLNFWIEDFHIKSSLSFELIRQKIQRYNEMEGCGNPWLKISLPEDDERTIDFKTLFPNAQYLGDNGFDLGRVQAFILSPKSVYMMKLVND